VLGGNSHAAAYAPVNISAVALVKLQKQQEIARQVAYGRDENRDKENTEGRDSSGSDETEYTSATEVRDAATTCTVKRAT
jgi:hypothetical protein